MAGVRENIMVNVQIYIVNKGERQLKNLLFVGGPRSAHQGRKKLTQKISSKQTY